MKRFFVLFAIVLCVHVANAQTPPSFVEGRALAKFPSVARAAVVARQIGAVVKGQIGKTEVVVIEANIPAPVLLQELKSYPDLIFAELDMKLLPSTTIPNDPYFPSEWHLDIIDAPAAWDLTRGSTALTVAVLDTGVDSTHPDLSARVVPGWNVYDNNSNTADVYGHGTWVAGTIAAQTQNTLGVAAVTWYGYVMPIRISDPSGYGYYSTAAAGLDFATDHGVNVANISYEFSTSSTVAAAAQRFQQQGGVVTISAGNAGQTLLDPDNPYVLTVGATDPSDVLTSWSNRGPIVDLVAPGVDIWSTARGGGYQPVSGTSFSAPIVAGVAMLVKAINPSCTGAQIQQVVKLAATDLGAPGVDTTYGAGRVSAYNAVVLAAADCSPGTPIPPIPPPGKGHGHGHH